MCGSRRACAAGALLYEWSMMLLPAAGPPELGQKQ
jgi:hypothetical protein